jgi:hypothetical protein
MKRRLVVALSVVLCCGVFIISSCGSSSSQRFVDKGIGYIVWAKDGKSLFYTKSGGRLYQFDVRTGRKHVYRIPELLDAFDVSPDGCSVAFIHRSKPGLYALTLKTKRLVEICHVRNDYGVTSLSWCQPNSIVFSQEIRTGEEDIHLVDVRHGSSKKLLNRVGNYVGSTTDGTGLVYDDARSHLHYYDLKQKADRLLNTGHIAADTDDIGFLYLSRHQAIVTPGPWQLDLATMKAKRVGLPNAENLAMISPDLTRCLSGESAHPSAIFGWTSNRIYVTSLPEDISKELQRLERSYIGSRK